MALRKCPRALSNAVDMSNSKPVTPVSSLATTGKKWLQKQYYSTSIAYSLAIAVQSGACSNCQKCKICCMFLTDAVACVKCMKTSKTDTCVIQESCTCSHSSSAPPSSAQGVSHSADHNKLDIQLPQHSPKHAQAWKQANSETTQPPTHSKHQHPFTQTCAWPTCDCPLEQIPEEADDELVPIPNSAMLQSTREFFGMLSRHGPGLDSEDLESRDKEEININIDDDDPNSSDSADDDITELVCLGQWQQHSATKPTQGTAGLKRGAMSRGKVNVSSTSSSHNPEMCMSTGWESPNSGDLP
ncbi:hypothetical protein BKA83DRAFT_4133607 [Pisolithus microcarpus]|nr:hypothetical protein BKA83DRAFT_4133607 [Pisolithus microcarpus]